MNTIYFDMDGTIADLYGVDNWLDDLHNERPTPYAIAEPLLNMLRVTELLSDLQQKGYRIGIISWTSKGGTKNYNSKVRATKKEWLKNNLPLHFDEIHIVKYGTRKDYVAKDKDGIIFDDDIRVRDDWRGIAYNPDEIDIIQVLEELLQ